MSLVIIFSLKNVVVLGYKINVIIHFFSQNSERKNTIPKNFEKQFWNFFEIKNLNYVYWSLNCENLKSANV